MKLANNSTGHVNKHNKKELNLSVVYNSTYKHHEVMHAVPSNGAKSLSSVNLYTILEIWHFRIR